MSDVTPRVSVIIPCAPNSRYLAETLRSIEKQTYTDWEVLVVLDGEDEGNRQRVTETLPPDRVRILVIPAGSGPAVGRDLGIREARGELIALCDADDLCEPERFEHQVAEFDRRPGLGLLTAWARRFDSATGEDRGPWHYPIEPRKLARMLLLYNPVVTSTAMMRRSTTLEVGSFDQAALRVEDYDLWLRFLGRTEIAVLPEELLRYRFHDAQYSLGPVFGPATGLIRRRKVAAARRLGMSVPITLVRHVLWLGVQFIRGRW
jgi:glycosyltransferase involved in cell wall biosynthesis